MDQLRRRYSVTKGKLLDEGWRCRVDGEMGPEWKAVQTELHQWEHAMFERIRALPDAISLLPLLDNHIGGPRLAAAFDLRAAELATEPWPWPADKTEKQRAARFEGLDTVADLLAVMTSPGPHLRQTYRLLVDIEKLPTMLPLYVEKLVTAWDKRPALASQAKARLNEILVAQQNKPKASWEVARGIREMVDVEAQAAAVTAAPKNVLSELRPEQIIPEVRDGAYKARIAPKAAGCAVAGCGGWVKPSAYEYGTARCVKCNRTHDEWLRDARSSLQIALALVHDAADPLGQSGRPAGLLLMELLERFPDPNAGDAADEDVEDDEGPVVFEDVDDEDDLEDDEDLEDDGEAA